MQITLFDGTNNPSIYLDINQAQIIHSALHKIGRSESIKLICEIYFQELQKHGSAVLLKFVNQGFSNTVVLRLYVGDLRADSIKANAKAILKIGRYEDVHLEYSNYRKNLGQTKRDFVPKLISFAHLLERWAAVLYEDLGEIDTLQDLYLHDESEDILIESIRTIFGKMEQHWYKHATLELTSLYSDQFNLIQSIRKYQTAIRSLLPDEFNKQNIVLQIGGKPLTMKNPIHFLLKKMDSKEVITHISIVHGDCHGGNIVIDKKNNNVFLVDFANMRNNGHVFKDYVKLESNILYRLYDYDHSKNLGKSSDIWLDFVAFSLGYEVPLPNRPEDQKAWICIKELRNRAKKLKIDQFASDCWIEEYLIGVLHWTLSSIYWTDIFSSKKHLAFYSAALICHAIEHNHQIKV